MKCKNVFFLSFFLCITCFATTEPKVWGKNLYIEENLYDQENRYLRLNDGSFWLLNFTYGSFWDRFSGQDVQALWLAPQQLEIGYSSNHKFPYLIKNLYTKQEVEARQINPKLMLYTTIEKLRLSITSGLSSISSSIDKLYKPQTQTQPKPAQP